MNLDETAAFMLGTLKNQGIGKKPYIFVVHSLGGLLVKKILLKANITQEYQELSLMCKSILFFGVPHTGSGWANLLNFAKPILRNSNLLTALPKDSDSLHTLAMDFNNFVIQKKIETYVFYETKEVRATGFLAWLLFKKGIVIVSQESATKVHSSNQNVPLPADHLSICKIESKTSDLYVNRITGIINSLIEINQEMKENEKKEQKVKENEKTVQQNNSITIGGSNSSNIITGNNNIVN